MKRKTLIFPSLIILALSLSSWGDVGHSMISLRIDLSFNDEMSEFTDWIPYLSEHASDADWRKKDDPEEGPKHYIDIDNYEIFVSEGRIPQTLDSCIAEYGSDFVGDNGYLPWATLAMYDSVVNCLSRLDWDNAKKYAADLGHYVADGHMPMHLTKNYDGQFTGNKGIHYRYEIGMINKYADQISYTGSPAKRIENVSEYMFSYIYENYKYMDSILIADNYGKEMNPDVESDIYYYALWERTENMTNVLFERASHALAEMLYSAWTEAGKPSSTPSGIATINTNTFSINVSPNPVRNFASIKYSAPLNGKLSAAIYDSTGRIATSFDTEFSGTNSFQWDSKQFENGAYVFVVRNNEMLESKIILVSN